MKRLQKIIIAFYNKKLNFKNFPKSYFLHSEKNLEPVNDHFYGKTCLILAGRGLSQIIYVRNILKRWRINAISIRRYDFTSTCLRFNSSLSMGKFLINLGSNVILENLNSSYILSVWFFENLKQ